MPDTPEETARRRQLLQEIHDLEEGMGLHNEQLTIDEIVAITKQVRKEMAEERKMSEGNGKVYPSARKLVK